MADDKFSKEVVIAGEPYRIPKEEFFNERKARLFSYFTHCYSADCTKVRVTLSIKGGKHYGEKYR